MPLASGVARTTLAFCVFVVGCGGSTDPVPPQPPSPPSPPGPALSPVVGVIGPDGGVLEANVGDGVTLRLEVPAGAMGRLDTVRILPRIPEAGVIATAQLLPAGLILRRPARLSATRASGALLSSTTRLAFRSGATTWFQSGDLLNGQRTLAADLRRLGGTTAAGVLAVHAQRDSMRALQATSSGPDGTLVLLDADFPAMRAALRGALDVVGGVPSPDAFEGLHETGSALIASYPDSARVNATAVALVEEWRTRACARYESAGIRLTSLLNPLDLPEYTRRLRDFALLARQINELPATLARVGRGACTVAQSDIYLPVTANLAGYAAQVRRTVNALDPLRQFDSLVTTVGLGAVELRQVLQSSGPLANQAPVALSMAAAALERARVGGFRECQLSLPAQRLQQRLLQALAADSGLRLAAPALSGELLVDINQCGFGATWVLFTEAGTPFITRPTRISPDSAPLTTVVQVDARPAVRLEVQGALQRVLCPSGRSPAEALVLRVVRPDGSRVVVATAGAGVDGRFDLSRFRLTTDSLRRAAAPSVPLPRDVTAELTRTGPSCADEFTAQPLAPPVLQLQLRLAGTQQDEFAATQFTVRTLRTGSFGAGDSVRTAFPNGRAWVETTPTRGQFLFGSALSGPAMAGYVSTTCGPDDLNRAALNRLCSLAFSTSALPEIANVGVTFVEPGVTISYRSRGELSGDVLSATFEVDTTFAAPLAPGRVSRVYQFVGPRINRVE